MQSRARFKILVVDDSEDTLTLLDIFISQRGFTVYLACDFESAMDQIDLGEINVVVSDIQMPGRSGIELLKTIRSTDAELPFFLFSCCSESYEREAIKCGATRVLRKDRFIELVDLIDKFYSDSLFCPTNHANCVLFRNSSSLGTSSLSKMPVNRLRSSRSFNSSSR